MCSYPHLQYHFGQYELDCHRRDTPREVHEQRFAGSSFAHHLLQSNTNFQALLLADAQSRILTVLPAVAQRFRLGVASFAFSARVSGREVTWLLRRLFGSGQRAGTLCFFRRERLPARRRGRGAISRSPRTSAGEGAALARGAGWRPAPRRVRISSVRSPP